MTRLSFVLLFAFFLHTPALAAKASAWIAPWDAASLTSIELHGEKLDESNPVWYSLAADGSIVANWNAENPTWRAAMTGTALVPTIQNVVGGRFDASLLASLLETEDSRSRHADAIVALVLSRGFDGIDLDYEALPATERDRFSSFVETLAAKLHAAGRTLSVTVHAKTSDSQNWKGPGAHDYRRLGAAADSVKIMAYDYHWATSDPGPIAPLDWIEAVARYAASEIPPEKIWIALPWYGYDWGPDGGAGVSWRRATELAAAHGATVSRSVDGEATFTYPGHTVYFQDAESYRWKVERLLESVPSLGGIANWRAGQEDPAIWQVIASSIGSGGSGGSSPRGSFEISGEGAVSLRPRQQARLSWRVVPIDGFTSTVRAVVDSSGGFPGTIQLIRPVAGGGETLVVELAAAADASPGTYRMRIRFDGGTDSVTREIEVTVEGRRRAARR